MSNSLRPHRRQPTRLPHRWDSPGKNTGVGCHFLLRCMKVKSESEFAQSCPTLSDQMDYSLPGSSIHGSFRARVLEWVAISFSEFICSAFEFRVLGQIKKIIYKLSINVILVACRSWRLLCENSAPRFHVFVSLNSQG